MTRLGGRRQFGEGGVDQVLRDAGAVQQRRAGAVEYVGQRGGPQVLYQQHGRGERHVVDNSS